MKFENELNKITGRTTTMGIEELLLAQARHEGEVKGEQRGEQRGEARGEKMGEARMKEAKERSFVQSLLRNTDFDNRKIAFLAGVTEAFVKRVRTGSNVI